MVVELDQGGQFGHGGQSGKPEWYAFINIWLMWRKQSNCWENLRCRACDLRTHRREDERRAVFGQIVIVDIYFFFQFLQSVISDNFLEIVIVDQSFQILQIVF